MRFAVCQRTTTDDVVCCRAAMRQVDVWRRAVSERALKDVLSDSKQYDMQLNPQWHL